MTDQIHALDQRLLKAHAQDDRAALVGLYAEASDAAGHDTARGFYLTHAFVYALEFGDSRADGLRDRLAGMGRL